MSEDQLIYTLMLCALFYVCVTTGRVKHAVQQTVVIMLPFLSFAEPRNVFSFISGLSTTLSCLRQALLGGLFGASHSLDCHGSCTHSEVSLAGHANS
jgi:hypothetical protein